MDRDMHAHGMTVTKFCNQTRWEERTDMRFIISG